MNRYRLAEDVTISSGSATSGAVEDLKGYRLARIVMPGAWTAADLKIQTKAGPNGTYQDLYDEAGNLVVIEAAASRNINIGADTSEEILGAYGLRLVGWDAGAGSAVNQGADRTLTLELVSD